VKHTSEMPKENSDWFPTVQQCKENAMDEKACSRKRVSNLWNGVGELVEDAMHVFVECLTEM